MSRSLSSSEPILAAGERKAFWVPRYCDLFRASDNLLITWMGTQQLINWEKNIIDKLCTFSLWILGVRSNSSLDIVHFGVSRSTGKWNFYEISNILSVLLLLGTIMSTDWQRAASSHPSAVRQQQCSARLSASNFQRANIQIVKQRPVFPLSGLTIFLCHQTCNL